MTDTHETRELLNIFSVMKNFGGHAATFAMRDPPNGGTCGDTASIYDVSPGTEDSFDRPPP